MVQKVTGKSLAGRKLAPGVAIRRLENCLCQPSRKRVNFVEMEKDKVAKKEELAPPFVCSAQDTVGLYPSMPCSY